MKLNREVIVPEIPQEFLPPAQFLPQTVKSISGLDYPRRLNLAKVLLDAHLDKHADKTAILFNSERITYSELHQKVNQFANAMRQLGINKNDRVMLRSHN